MKYRRPTSTTTKMILFFSFFSIVPSLSFAQFQEVKTGIILDTNTTIMWQKTDDGDLKTLHEACRYCESLELGGYKDWQLGEGNISLLLDTLKINPPKIDPIFNCRSYHYWNWYSYGTNSASYFYPNGDTVWIDGANFGTGYDWIDLQENNYQCYTRCSRDASTPNFYCFINANKTSGGTPLLINFTCSSDTGTPPYTYEWIFGDQSTSNLQNPTHTYNSVGQFSAKVTVTDNTGKISSDRVMIIVSQGVNTYYRDYDSDGFGNPTNSCEATSQPLGYVTDHTDCDDYESNVNPNATEICGDGIDQDCSGNDPVCPKDTDSDGLMDDLENASDCLNSSDADTDDDGIRDGVEDADQDGMIDSGETNPCDADTDDDNIQDGTELGYTLDDLGPGTDILIFMPDADPSNTTNPLLIDTDRDGISDGIEDFNHNGKIDKGETNPNSKGLSWLPLLLE